MTDSGWRTESWTDNDLSLLQALLERAYDASASLKRWPDAPASEQEYQQRKLAACMRLANALSNPRPTAQLG